MSNDSVLSSSRPKNTHVRALDTVRALAVAMVLFHHIWGLGGAPDLHPTFLGVRLPMASLLQGAGLGVDIFFVLSGYLLSLPWHRLESEGRYPTLGKYLHKRLRRIVPPYYGVIVIVLIFMHPSVIPWGSIHTEGGIKRTVAHLLFAQQLFPISSGGYGALGSLWTLTIEMIFYLSLPIIILGFVKGRWRVGLPVSALVSIAWLWGSRHGLNFIVAMARDSVGRYGVSDQTLRVTWLSNQFPSFLFDFALGISAARVAVRGDIRLRVLHAARSTWGSLLIGATGLGVMYFSLYVNGSQRWSRLAYYGDHWLAAAGTVLLIFATMNPVTVFTRILSWKPLTWLGTIGYSVFLWHMPLIYVVNSYPWLIGVSPRTHTLRLTYLVVPLTLVISIPYYLLVERPFMSSSKSLAPPINA